MRKLVIGMLAHVDAGKTTLSESILYTSGAIRKLGRVDNKDAFLDYQLFQAFLLHLMYTVYIRCNKKAWKS